MKISLIIPYYKRPDFLKLVFLGLKNQSFQDFELILAEDDNDPATQEFLRLKSSDVDFPIQHISQIDNGFRKVAALNKAVKVAKAEFIVFLDGDCIPHKHFLAQYAKNIDKKTALYGRRVMVSKRLTSTLIQNNSLSYLNLVNLVITGSSRIEDGIYLPNKSISKNKKRGIWGCNWGVAKKHLLTVNGFDEDYKYAGIAEDDDIEWRLRETGVKLKHLKNKAIIFHLYHDANYTPEEVLVNRNLLAKKQEVSEFYCQNGIIKN